jgi:hypothetical protein
MRVGTLGWTVTLFDVPVMLVTVSVTVTVWIPAVLNLTGKVPAPEMSLLFPGSIARPSLLENCTVPA